MSTCPNCGRPLNEKPVFSLTPRQSELHRYLADYNTANGIMPTNEEIARHFRLKSKSSSHRLIDQLEERGVVRRLKKRARALQLLREPA